MAYPCTHSDFYSTSRTLTLLTSLDSSYKQPSGNGSPGPALSNTLVLCAKVANVKLISEEQIQPSYRLFAILQTIKIILTFANHVFYLILHICNVFNLNSLL